MSVINHFKFLVRSTNVIKLKGSLILKLIGEKS